MTTVTTEKFRSGQERLKAAIQAARQHRQELLDLVGEIIRNERELEQFLRQVVRDGVEKETLVEIVTPATLAEVADTCAVLREQIAMIEHDAEASSKIKLQLRETEQFSEWLSGLAAMLSKPIPPFDESKLPALPEGPPEGFVTIGEARALLKAMKQS